MEWLNDLKDSLSKMKIDDLGIAGIGGLLGKKAGGAFGQGLGMHAGAGGMLGGGLGMLGALYLYNQYKQNQGGGEGEGNLLPEGGINLAGGKASPKIMPSNAYSGPNTEQGAGVSDKQVAQFLADYNTQGNMFQEDATNLDRLYNPSTRGEEQWM